MNSRDVLSFDLSKGKIGFSVKYLGNLIIEQSPAVIFMKCALTFAKDSEELSYVKMDFHHISKSSFLEKITFKTLPNAHYFFGFKKHFLPKESANKQAPY